LLRTGRRVAAVVGAAWVGLGAGSTSDAPAAVRVSGPAEDLVVDGSFVYYRSWSARRQLVRRTHLRTGRTRTLWSGPAEGFFVMSLDASQGRVAIGLDEITYPRQPEPGVNLRGRTRVVLVSAGGRRRRTVASGRFEPQPERDCGNMVVLRALEPTRSVIVERRSSRATASTAAPSHSSGSAPRGRRS
jgi:hypothetical protein